MSCTLFGREHTPPFLTLLGSSLQGVLWPECCSDIFGDGNHAVALNGRHWSVSLRLTAGRCSSEKRRPRPFYMIFDPGRWGALERTSQLVGRAQISFHWILTGELFRDISLRIEIHVVLRARPADLIYIEI
jgi:hypothetical protein